MKNRETTDNLQCPKKASWLPSAIDTALILPLNQYLQMIYLPSYKIFKINTSIRKGTCAKLSLRPQGLHSIIYRRFDVQIIMSLERGTPCILTLWNRRSFERLRQEIPPSRPQISITHLNTIRNAKIFGSFSQAFREFFKTVSLTMSPYQGPQAKISLRYN